MKLEFTESNDEIISLNNALPETDEKGMEEDPFMFSVVTKTSKTQDMKYNLYIEKMEVDIGYEGLNDKDVKVALTDYEDNVLVEPVLISDLEGYKLYSKTNSHSNENNVIKDKYKLRAWVDYMVKMV